MRIRLPGRWSSAIIGAVIALAGCSSTPPKPPPATRLVAAMKAALARASSARFSGNTGPGQTEPLDLLLTRSGDASGLESYGGVTITLTVARGRTYVLLNPAYYRYLTAHHKVLSAPCATICGRYILENLAVSPLQGVFGAFLKVIPLEARVTAKTPVRTVTYRGQAAYEFADGNGDRIYVLRADYPYPAAIVGGQGTMRFSQWNTVPPITAPPASKVIAERALFVGG